MNTIFDVVVIGGGPGGYVCAIKLSQLGHKVALIEKYSTLGGTCLNVGCIPSKAFLDSSEKFFELKSLNSHGIDLPQVSLSWEKMKSRVQKVVSTTCEGINFLMKKNAITVINGKAGFINAKSIEVTTIDGQEKKIINSNNFVIATGSKPTNLPHIKIDKKRIISSTEALKLNEIPKRLLVIGAGAIGLELSSVYARLGSQVQVFEYANSILPLMDAEVSKELSKVLKKEGITIHTATKVSSVTSNEQEVALKAESLIDKKEVQAIGDYVLLAVGRSAYTDGLNLEKIGVSLDKFGKIIVNENLQTTHNNIYAIGDVIHGPMLAHKAEEEGIFVAEVISGQRPKLKHDLIPSIVYTWPEVAAIGKTEEQLKNENIAYKKGVFPFKALGRARASEEFFGLVKVLTHDKTDQLLGVHMIGPRAADLIMQAVTAMTYKASAEDIARICHGHPTYTEAFKEAAHGAWSGKYIHL